MQWKTHLAGGILASNVVILASARQDFGVSHVEPVFYVAIITVAMGGSLFPDIDLHTSKIGRKYPKMSKVINLLIGHRTLFHAPALYILLYLALAPLLGSFATILLAFIAGTMSHIVLDCLNAKGIPILYPLGGKYHFASIRTGGAGEKIVLISLIAIDIFSFANMIQVCSRLEGIL